MTTTTPITTMTTDKARPATPATPDPSASPHYVAICPGFHPSELTDRAIAALDLPPTWEAIAIPNRIWPCDPAGISAHLAAQIPPDRRAIPIHFLGFSAGTVGALGAALAWRSPIATIALCDGWGVPVLPLLDGRSPQPTIHRVSHDRWTHETWGRMGIATPSFCADPEVEHLELWGDLDRVTGRAFDRRGREIGTSTAKNYIRRSLGLDGAETPANDTGDADRA